MSKKGNDYGYWHLLEYWYFVNDMILSRYYPMLYVFFNELKIRSATFISSMKEHKITGFEKKARYVISQKEVT